MSKRLLWGGPHDPQVGPLAGFVKVLRRPAGQGPAADEGVRPTCYDRR